MRNYYEGPRVVLQCPKACQDKPHKYLCFFGLCLCLPGHAGPECLVVFREASAATGGASGFELRDTLAAAAANRTDAAIVESAAATSSTPSALSLLEAAPAVVEDPAGAMPFGTSAADGTGTGAPLSGPNAAAFGKSVRAQMRDVNALSGELTRLGGTGLKQCQTPGYGKQFEEVSPLPPAPDESEPSGLDSRPQVGFEREAPKEALTPRGADGMAGLPPDRVHAVYGPLEPPDGQDDSPHERAPVEVMGDAMPGSPTELAASSLFGGGAASMLQEAERAAAAAEAEAGAGFVCSPTKAVEKWLIGIECKHVRLIEAHNVGTPHATAEFEQLQLSEGVGAFLQMGEEARARQVDVHRGEGLSDFAALGVETAATRGRRIPALGRKLRREAKALARDFRAAVEGHAGSDDAVAALLDGHTSVDGAASLLELAGGTEGCGGVFGALGSLIADIVNLIMAFIFTLLTALVPSDATLKRDVTPLVGRGWGGGGGGTPAVPMYTFRYRGDPHGQLYRGAMAQDLLATRAHAHAVWRLRPGGPLLVNYALLDGVTFCAARPDGRCVDGAG